MAAPPPLSLATRARFLGVAMGAASDSVPRCVTGVQALARLWLCS